MLLSRLLPAVQAANLRKPLSDVAAAVGVAAVDALEVRRDVMAQVGDVVVGDVVVDPQRAGGPVAVLDNTGREVYVQDRLRVLAPVGNRESSTHHCGGVPDGGLDVCATDGGVAWLTGSSGLVGKLLWEDPDATASAPAFEGLGVLCVPGTGEPLNTMRHFAVSPAASVVTKPIIAVAATSAEAGKTTMSGRIIDVLNHRLGLSCVTVKATGTGA